MRRLIYKIFLNNPVSNFFIRLFNIEKFIYENKKSYVHFKVNKNKSVQENAGYSERTEINEVIEKSKHDLQLCVSQHLKQNGKVLDIGCGPGMYLNLFKDKNYELHATDINQDMIDEAKKNVPGENYYQGNFIELDFKEKFDFIYCIGVLIYIGRKDIEFFFQKIHSLLNKDGILYLNYPHAISIGDLLYKDLTYIQYSPKLIEKLIEPYFTIIEHHHAFDGRTVNKYDKQPYKSLNPNTDRTYKNSYLLIAKKK